MESTIDINKGESLELALEYSELANLVGVSISIKEARPLALMGATITKTDELNSIATLFMSKEISSKLNIGENNWFRIELVFPNGQNSVSPQIWINVI
jgi:hypothetical protein